MKRILTKFIHAFRGLGFALYTDRGVQQVVFCGAVGLVGLHVLFGPFTDAGNLVLILCFFLVIITELQNTALERALDTVHPGQHESIGRSKDIAAASVLCAAVFSLVCVYFVATGKI